MKIICNVSDLEMQQSVGFYEKQIAENLGGTVADIRPFDISPMSAFGPRRHGQCTARVRFWGQSGHDPLRMSAFTVALGCKADIAFCGANVYF